MKGLSLKDIELAEDIESGIIKLSFIFSNATKYSIMVEKGMDLRLFCNDLQAVSGEIRRIYATPSDMGTSRTH